MALFKGSNGLRWCQKYLIERKGGFQRFSSSSSSTKHDDLKANILNSGDPTVRADVVMEKKLLHPHLQQNHPPKLQQQAYVASVDRPKHTKANPIGKKLWVGNLPYEVEWQDLKDHFKPFGHILHARVLIDSSTGMSKGCGIVEFGSTAEATRVMARTNGSELGGRAIFVREDRAECALNTENKTCCISITNLSTSLQWQELKDHFRTAGQVLRANIIYDERSGRSKGCGVVEYANEADARYARSTLDGTEIMGKAIQVSEYRDEST